MNVTTLAQFTSPSLIVPRFRSRDTAAVIWELCLILQREGRLKDSLPFYNTVMNQEILGSTATSPGWALPHARLKGLSQLSFAVGRSDPPLDWLGRGGQGVRLVFLFAVPDTQATTFLGLMSGLARLGQDPAGTESLLRATDSEMILTLLGKIRLRQPEEPVSTT
jgi:mannitol/fructose-specific phosphotransferase system IIA component (Ntr-type)